MDETHQRKPMARPQPRQPSADVPVDYAHRSTVNLVAVIAVLVLGGCLLWIFNGLEAQRKLERCVQAGRKDCAALPGQAGHLAAPPP